MNQHHFVFHHSLQYNTECLMAKCKKLCMDEKFQVVFWLEVDVNSETVQFLLLLVVSLKNLICDQK